MSERGSVNVSVSAGSLPVLVFIVFLVLKLATIDPVAAWSWWWVTSPLWIPLALAVTAITVFIVGGALGTLILAAIVFFVEWWDS